MGQRNWQRWEVAGLFFTIAVGNLLHFVYEWSGEHVIAALFSGVNESTWEHMKLLAVPWIAWTAVELAVGCGGALLGPRTVGLLVGLVAIPALYYTYTGALGVNSSLVNIIIFQLAVLLAFGVSFSLRRRRRLSGRLWQVLGGAVLVSVTALLIWWTFAPPLLPLFVDPVTGLAGRE